MKIFAFLLMTFVFSAAFAQSTVKDLFASPAMADVCSKVVAPAQGAPGYWYLNYPSYALTADTLYATERLDSGAFAVVKIDRAQPAATQEVVRFDKYIRDINFHDGKLWVLQNELLTSVDPLSGKILTQTKTYDLPALPRPGDDYAHAMAWMGEHLVIAHGSLGITVYDPKANAITMANAVGMKDGMFLSKAIDVTAISDHEILLGVDNVSVTDNPPYPFNGIMKVDFNSSSHFLTRYPYDAASSGWLSNAKIQLVGNDLIINDWGSLQIASYADMQKTGKTKVAIRTLPVTAINGVKPISSELMGAFFVEQGSFISCSQASIPVANDRPVHVGLPFITTY